MSDLPVAERWFRAEDVGLGITRLWEPHVDDFLESNVWHVRGKGRDLIVDTANGIGRLAPEVAALAEGRPVIAVATHGHFDHVGGLHELDDRRVHRADADMTRRPFPLRMRRRDFPDGTEEMFAYFGAPVPDVIVGAVPEDGFDVDGWVAPGAEPTALISEGDLLDLGDRAFEVLHTPGHTAGSVCLWDADTGVLFTGDTIYADARLEFPDRPDAERSLERVASLPVRVAHTGHGRSVAGAELRKLCADALDEVRGAGDVRAGDAG